MAGKIAPRIRVDRHRDRLAGAHPVEFGLLEIRRDPDGVGHEHAERRSRSHILADAGGKVCDAPGLIGADNRVGEIEPRLIALRLRLFQGGLGVARWAFSVSICRSASLCVAWAESSAACCWLAARNIAGRSRPCPTGSRKRLKSGGLLLGEDKRRLRLVHLRLVGGDLRLLRGDLGVAALRFRPRRRRPALRPARGPHRNREGRCGRSRRLC